MTTTVTIQPAGHRVRVQTIHLDNEGNARTDVQENETILEPGDPAKAFYVHSHMNLAVSEIKTEPEKRSDPRDSLPVFQSHKKVRAVKIESVLYDRPGLPTCLIVPKGGGAEIETSVDWSTRFKRVGPDMGYYVLYEDGYDSWSPSKPFEEGYTPFTPD